jgi:YfiR/HmsC-like
VDAKERPMKMLMKSHVAKAAAIVFMALLVIPRPAGAVDSSPKSPEYLIKAAYLYNFAMFVEWPSDAFARPDSSVVIGVVGADPFGWALDRTVQDKKIGKRQIVIERLQWGQDARRCHIVFVSGSDVARLSELAARLEGSPTLIVTDGDNARRSAISFVVNDNKVGFEINLDQASRARLSISSKLLNLARVVR